MSDTSHTIEAGDKLRSSIHDFWKGPNPAVDKEKLTGVVTVSWREDSYPCHKVVLAHHCKALREQFEQNPNLDSIVIPKDFFTGDSGGKLNNREIERARKSVSCFFESLYSGKGQVDCDVLVNMLKLAVYYKCDSLTKIFTQALLDLVATMKDVDVVKAIVRRMSHLGLDAQAQKVVKQGFRTESKQKGSERDRNTLLLAFQNEVRVMISKAGEEAVQWRALKPWLGGLSAGVLTCFINSLTVAQASAFDRAALIGMCVEGREDKLTDEDKAILDKCVSSVEAQGSWKEGPFSSAEWLPVKERRKLLLGALTRRSRALDNFRKEIDYLNVPDYVSRWYEYSWLDTLDKTKEQREPVDMLEFLSTLGENCKANPQSMGFVSIESIQGPGTITVAGCENSQLLLGRGYWLCTSTDGEPWYIIKLLDGSLKTDSVCISCRPKGRSRPDMKGVAFDFNGQSNKPVIAFDSNGEAQLSLTNDSVNSTFRFIFKDNYVRSDKMAVARMSKCVIKGKFMP